MRTIGANLETHFGLPSATYTFCWRVTPRYGAAEGYTALDRDLTISGLVYRSKSNVLPTSIPTELALSIDAVDVVIVFEAGQFDRRRLLVGYYNDAEITLFAVNYNGTLTEQVVLMGGYLGQPEINDTGATIELLPLSALANKPIGRTVQPLCDVERFGRGRCRNLTLLDGPDVTSATYTKTGTVASVVSASELTLSGITGAANDWATYGILRFTSGDNSGVEREVKRWQATGKLWLHLPLPYLPVAGNAVALEAGCARTYAACKVFNNLNNFRGFPFVPGREGVIRQYGR